MKTRYGCLLWVQRLNYVIPLPLWCIFCYVKPCYQIWLHLLIELITLAYITVHVFSFPIPWSGFWWQQTTIHYIFTIPFEPEIKHRCRPLPQAPTSIKKWQSTWETPRIYRSLECGPVWLLYMTSLEHSIVLFRGASGLTYKRFMWPMVLRSSSLILCSFISYLVGLWYYLTPWKLQM